MKEPVHMYPTDAVDWVFRHTGDDVYRVPGPGTIIRQTVPGGPILVLVRDDTDGRYFWAAARRIQRVGRPSDL